MTALLDRSKFLTLLGAATCVLSALTGCGGGSSPAKPQAAKTMYVVSYTNDASNNNAPVDSVLGYSTASPGSTTPTTTLNLPEGFYVDSIATDTKGQLYVAGSTASSSSDSIFVFPAGATGSATATTILAGSATPNNGTFTYADYMSVNSSGQLFVFSDDYTVEVFASGLTSSSVPAQYITWGTQNNNFSDVYNIASDGKGETFISDYSNNEIFVFAAGATGNAAPVRTITGTDVDTFDEIWTMTADDAGNVYVVNWNRADMPGLNATPHTQVPAHRHHAGTTNVAARPHTANPSGTLPTGIIVFAAGANGNATPMRTLSGSTTGVVYPAGLAVDAVSNIYYLDWNTSTPLLMMFPPTATGNTAPLLSIAMPTGFDVGFDEIAVF
jgi:hypothetical protein